MDKKKYRTICRFSDEYFDWLESENLFCPDENMLGVMCNSLWLNIYSVHHGDVDWAKECIQNARHVVENSNGPQSVEKITFIEEPSISPEQRDKESEIAFFTFNVLYGICYLLGAKWRIENSEFAKAVSLLLDAGICLGKATGTKKSMDDSKSKRSNHARRMADAIHGKEGGSRSKQEAIRKIWASGKHGTREKCAELEHASVGMSFSAARKALRNTQDPKRA